MVFATAFQPNAFQNNAFQVNSAPVANNLQGDGEDRKRRKHVNQRRLRPIYAPPEPKPEPARRKKEHIEPAEQLRAALFAFPTGAPLPIGEAPNYALLQMAQPADNAAELAQRIAQQAHARRLQQDEDDVIALLLS